MGVEASRIDLREKDRTALVDYFGSCPEVERVYLFGSRATGTAHGISDIDLAVEAPGMSGGQWARFVLDLEELPIILHFDAVRLDTLRDEGLEQRIDATAQLLYERSATA